MKKIGILFGQENSFPGALVEHINARNVDGITAEFVQTGAVYMDQKRPRSTPSSSTASPTTSPSIAPSSSTPPSTAPSSSTIPSGGRPTTSSSTTPSPQKLGVAVPPTVILPHKKHPEGTTDRSMRNLEYPLDWDSVFRLRRRAWLSQAHRWRRLARRPPHPQPRGVLPRLR
jgi:hypothetical protein